MNIKYLKSNIGAITKKLYHSSVGSVEFTTYIYTFAKLTDYIENYTTHDPIVLVPYGLIGIYASIDPITRIFFNENLVKFLKRTKKEEKEEKTKTITTEQIKKIINTEF